LELVTELPLKILARGRWEVRDIESNPIGHEICESRQEFERVSKLLTEFVIQYLERTSLAEKSSNRCRSIRTITAPDHRT
jgi:hypothetical protein